MLKKAHSTTCITECILWGRYHLHTGDYILGGKQTLIGLVVAHRFRQVHAFHFIRNKTMSVQIEQSPAMGGYKMIIWAACDEMSVIRHMKILEFCICFGNREKYSFKNLLSEVRVVGRKSLACFYTCEYIFPDYLSFQL